MNIFMGTIADKPRPWRMPVAYKPAGVSQAFVVDFY